MFLAVKEKLDFGVSGIVHSALDFCIYFYFSMMCNIIEKTNLLLTDTLFAIRMSNMISGRKR